MNFDWLPTWAQWTAGFLGLGVLARVALWTWSFIRRLLTAIFRRLWLLFAPTRWDLAAHADSIVVLVDQQHAELHLGDAPRLELWLRYANLGPRAARFTLSGIEFSAASRSVDLSCAAVKELPSQMGEPKAGQGTGQHIIRLDLPDAAAETIARHVGGQKSPEPFLLRTTVQLKGHMLLDGEGREVRLNVPVGFAVWTHLEDLPAALKSPRARELVGSGNTLGSDVEP